MVWIIWRREKYFALPGFEPRTFQSLAWSLIINLHMKKWNGLVKLLHA
jgi:hypothetical protein